MSGLHLKIWAILLCIALTACSRQLPDDVTELTYATPYSPAHPFSKADQRWIDYVAKQSKGKLIIKPIWSGALLSSDMSMEEIRHGVADIGLVTPIYTRGGAHLIRVQTGFYSGAHSIEDQLAVYECLEQNIPQIGREMAGLKTLAVQGGLLPGVLTTSKKVESLEDLKGLRIRAPTELLPVLESLGADPVSMPMGEVYSALAKGVLDGVVAPADTFRSLHFSEVTSHYYELRIPRGAYAARVIDMDRWQTLEDWQAELLDQSTPVWEQALIEEIYLSEQVGRDAAVGHIASTPASAAVQSRFDDIYLEISEQNARELERYGIDGLEAFRLAQQSLASGDGVQCRDVS